MGAAHPTTQRMGYQMRYFYGYVVKTTVLIPIKVKACDSNQAYDVAENIGKPITGFYPEAYMAELSVPTSIEIPNCDWMGV